jgi:hypothetical protein
MPSFNRPRLPRRKRSRRALKQRQFWQYAGLVLLATPVLRIHGSVAVAAATLVAAALFSPLRRRVQLAVDRTIWIGRADPAGFAQAGGHSFATRVSTS